MRLTCKNCGKTLVGVRSLYCSDKCADAVSAKRFYYRHKNTDDADKTISEESQDSVLHSANDTVFELISTLDPPDAINVKGYMLEPDAARRMKDVERAHLLGIEFITYKRDYLNRVASHLRIKGV